MNQMIISIDPGREKCGLAVVHRQEGVLEKRIIETQQLAAAVKTWALEYHLRNVIMGDGTSSREAKKFLQDIKIDGDSIQIVFVDEYRSTDEARQRYWRENPPRGIMRLIPVTMQVPPQPVDDYVAVILAERYFAAN